MWCVAFEEALGGPKRHTDGYAVGLCHGLRHARNRLVHGDATWEPIYNSTPGRQAVPTPLNWTWRWRSLDKPANNRWWLQWLSYQVTMPPRGVDEVLRDYTFEVLG